MCEKFTASNGVVVEIRDGRLEWVNAPHDLSGESYPGWLITALREFFLHERDQELCRWRWPDSPGYVVYPVGRTIRVVCERSGSSFTFEGPDDARFDGGAHGAAKAFFEQRPLPWWDAQPGEKWLVTRSGFKPAHAVVKEGRDSLCFFVFEDTGFNTVTSSMVAYAERVWGEEGDDE